MKAKTIAEVVEKQRLRKAKAAFKKEGQTKPKLVYNSSGKHFKTNN